MKLCIIGATFVVYSAALRLPVPEDKRDLAVKTVASDDRKPAVDMDIIEFEALVNKTKHQVHNAVMIAEVNSGYHAMMTNWLLHVKKAGIKNYLLVALDRFEFQALQKAGEPVVSSDILFKYASRNLGYNEIVKNKWAIVDSVLNTGVNVLLTDIDVIWFQDPFDYMASHDAHCSMLLTTSTNDPNLNKPNKVRRFLDLNTGIAYFRANDETKRMLTAFREFSSTERFSGLDDQALLFRFLQTVFYEPRRDMSPDQCNANGSPPNPQQDGMTLSWQKLPRELFADTDVWGTHDDPQFRGSAFALHYWRGRGPGRKAALMKMYGHWFGPDVEVHTGEMMEPLTNNGRAPNTKEPQVEEETEDPEFPSDKFPKNRHKRRTPGEDVYATAFTKPLNQMR